MPDDMTTRLSVNGKQVMLRTAPEASLLLALRTELDLRGARVGCGIGECGACTVLVDGEALPACITPLSAVQDASVTTPEGLGTPESPHPVQQAFLDEQAAQCGYCINGIIMSVAAHADDAGRLRDPDLAGALERHLCRCGTHARILSVIGRLAGVDFSARTLTRVDVPCAAASDDGRGSATPSVGSDVWRWLRLLPDGRVEVRTGKIEIGQGLHTALAQLVAAGLDLSVEAVTVHPPATDDVPDEGYTAGSTSLEDSGDSLAQAAAGLRRLIRERAAAILGCEPAAVELRCGRVLHRDTGTELTLQAIRETGELRGPILETDRPRGHAHAPVGEPVSREDLRAKLTGASAYIHDLAFPGMRHARVLRPPQTADRLVDIDVEAARARPGVVEVVAEGSLVIVVAEHEQAAIGGVTRLSRTARWEEAGLSLGGPDVVRHLEELPAEPFVFRQEGDVDRELASEQRLEATYTKPYQAHGAMAPSCAIALDDGDILTVWTHSQGIYPLRRELAVLLERPEAEIRLEHVDGPGCYGHNAADDAAAFAAVAARAVPGRPVRLQLTVEDEFLWEPYGPAMSARLAAGYDPVAGRITAWRARIRTDVHGARPNGDGNRLIAARLRAPDLPRPWMGPAENGARNADPIYDLPALDVVAEYVRGPLRTGSLRSLGAFLNVFAVESFMDELAEACGKDPLEFRLAHLRDDRARVVLEAAAEAAGWQPRVGPSGRGQGLALARYKGTKAYVAEVVELRFDEHVGTIHVDHIVIACDAGLVVNPDGLANQLEGGALQGLSRTLHEELRVDGRGVHSRDWTSYDVLRFTDVPRVDVVLIDRPEQPPLGAGESSTPPVPAAVANALDDSTGIRMRDLPLAPDRIRDRAMQLTEQEMARVRV